MTIAFNTRGPGQWWSGLSTDTKPTAASDSRVDTGQQFWEIDTQNVYQYSFANGWTIFKPIIGGDGNSDITLVTLTAAAASGNSADQINGNGHGLQMLVSITALTGTSPTLTVTVQGKDVASGQYYTLLASAALAATGNTLLTVYPGTTAAANTVVNMPLPRTWRVLYTIGGTTPAVTATIGASILI